MSTLDPSMFSDFPRDEWDGLTGEASSYGICARDQVDDNDGAAEPDGCLLAVVAPLVAALALVLGPWLIAIGLAWWLRE
jgi:hypothetical protein